METETQNNLDLDRCLEEAKEFQEEICGGINMRTRMAIQGMKAVGIFDPKGADRKNLMMFVGIDRCPTDSIIAVTGCHPGKRTMKILDYGKMAATFINLKTNKAVRVSSKSRQRDVIKNREMIENEPMNKNYYSVI